MLGPTEAHLPVQQNFLTLRHGRLALGLVFCLWYRGGESAAVELESDRATKLWGGPKDGEELLDGLRGQACGLGRAW